MKVARYGTAGEWATNLPTAVLNHFLDFIFIIAKNITV